MASSELTKLLLQRIRELTNPNRASEDIEHSLREYYATIIELRQEPLISDEEIRGISRDLSALRELLDALDRPLDRDRPFYPEISGNLNERFSELERRLNSLLRLKNTDDTVRNLENRLERLQSIGTFTAEHTLVEEYFSMSVNDFQSMTPEMHMLFLENMVNTNVDLPRENPNRLIETYIRHPSSILRYVVVHVIVKFHTEYSYLLRNLLDQIFKSYKDISQETIISELVSILIDLGTNMMSLQIQDELTTNPAFKALDDLVQFEQANSTNYVIRAVQSHLEG